MSWMAYYDNRPLRARSKTDPVEEAGEDVKRPLWPLRLGRIYEAIIGIDILYLVHALLISSHVIDIRTLSSGLKNNREHTKSKAVVDLDLVWKPTTYKVL